MKMSSLFKLSFLFVLLSFSASVLRAAEPTVTASNVSFAYVDAGQFNISFTSGNGQGRLVVVKEGSDITGKPVDGTAYGTGSIVYGTSASQVAPGEYAVYAGNQSSITITGVKKGTTYYIAIFEYNGSTGTPATLDYSQLTPTNQHITTLTTPTVQAQVTGFSLVTGNTLRVNYKNGNGNGRIVVARKGTGITALPVDYTFYNSNSAFKSSTGSTYYLDAETYIVLKYNSTNAGAADYIDVSSLEPNTTYSFAVFEYNGNQNANAPAFLTPTTVMSVTTNAGPTKAAYNLATSAPDGDRVTAGWNLGNGTKRLVIAKKGSAPTAVPVNNTAYTANAKFGLGTQIATDEYVVYNGTSSSVIVTGLEKSTQYYFAVYEYDVDGSGNTYFQSLPPATGNGYTALPPTGLSTVNVTSVTGSSATLSYTFASGAGYYRMLVIKDGSATDFVPQDGTVYGSGSSVFAAGTQVKTGTYVVISQGNGGIGTITNLTPGHTYYATAFESNGTYSPVYLTTGYTAVINIPAEPTTASTSLNYLYVEGNSMQLSWNSGNGGRRIVVARKGSSVTSVPVDGTTYTASAAFGAGTELTAGQGEYVVYDGAGSSVALTALEKGTTYYYAIFEYNTSATGPDYLTTAGKWLAGSKATVSAPTTQASNFSAYNILSTQASITFSVGNGTSRLFVVHEAAPVDATPQDLQTYSYNGNLTYSQQIGTGNYAVAIGSSAFLLSGLKASTQYYVTAFEYNGSSAPVYNTSGNAVFSFTTAAAPATVPTQAATAAAVSLVDGNRFRFGWTNGNGTNRIVVVRQGSAVSFTPADGTAYTANAAFGTSTDLGSGQYVVYNGASTNVDLTNLTKGTTYYLAVFEYNGTGSGTKYLSTALTANGTTAAAPTTVSSNAAVAPGTTTATLSFTAGNGSSRLVVMKEGSAVSGTPADYTTYGANAAFQNGTQIAAGEYVVYNGSGTSVTVTGLSANKTYNYTVFEYNGSSAPVYNSASMLSGSFSISSTLPVKWVAVKAQRGTNEVVVSWTAEETNVASYTVERSLDGAIYTALNTVTAKAQAGDNSYVYSDKSAGSAKQYYRIKQTDIDGRFTYSAVLTVDATEVATIKVLQNPARGIISFQSNPAEAVSYSIIDAAGRVLINKPVTQATTTFTINATEGIYYLQVRTKDGRTTNTSILYRP